MARYWPWGLGGARRAARRCGDKATVAAHRSSLSGHLIMMHDDVGAVIRRRKDGAYGCAGDGG